MRESAEDHPRNGLACPTLTDRTYYGPICLASLLFGQLINTAFTAVPPRRPRLHRILLRKLLQLHLHHPGLLHRLE